jgi:hypothetical protein
VKALLGTIVLVVVGAAVYGMVAASMESRPGSAAVHAEIESSTDCAWLQETFDRNMDRYEMMDASARTEEGSIGEVLRAYWDAADDRMSDIGCYS